MGNAAIVIDNQVDGAFVSASSQALTMPASTLLTPHPSDRWRSQTSSDFFVLDKGSIQAADTFLACGLTCGPNAIARLRLSTIDASGTVGNVLDTGNVASGSRFFDVDYGSFLYRFDEPTAWRYARLDLTDPDEDFVEAGALLDGLSEVFEINFSPASSIQHIDRSRVSPTSSGLTLTWRDNSFRRMDLSFDWVTATQRYGVVERLDRLKGKHSNVLLISDIAASNLPRASIFGLITDQTPVTFLPVAEMFGKQLRIDERI